VWDSHGDEVRHAGSANENELPAPTANADLATRWPDINGFLKQVGHRQPVPVQIGRDSWAAGAEFLQFLGQQLAETPWRDPASPPALAAPELTAS
jgi:hypothetical protein